MSQQNTLMVTGSALRRFCEECSKTYGIKIDVSFLDKYENQDFWFFEEMQNKKKGSNLLKVVEKCAPAGDSDFSVEAMTALKDHMISVWPEENETSQEFKERVELLKKEIRKEAENIDDGFHSYFFVVSHSAFVNKVRGEALHVALSSVLFTSF